MTRFSHMALVLGTAAAIATASSAFAGPIGPAGTQVKQAVPAGATDARFRRGAAIAAGVAIGVGFFGEHIDSGGLSPVLEVFGLAMVTFGVFALARSGLQAALPRWNVLDL